MRLAEELKDAVLQAAVTGALTVSKVNDTPVIKSVERIPQQKEDLRIKKKARNDAAFGDISPEEITFDIPDTWTWLRIGDIGIYKKGPFGSSLTKSMFVPRNTNSVKIYEQKNAIQKDYSLGDYYITKDYYKEKMEGFSVEAGDIIVSCAGTIGETYILPEDATPGIINQALMRMNIVQEVNINYFLIYFDHVLKQNAKRASKGTAIKNIPAFEVFKKMLFPFPPVEEQQRIVDRVNELMEQIDEYAKIEQQLISLKESFPGDLRSAILQAAMQGKLTEQLDSDSSVDELVSNINEIRQDLIKGKVYKEDKKLRPLSDDEIPFDIPDNWRWIKLGYCSTYGQSKEKATKEDIESEKWSLDLEDIEKTTGRVKQKIPAKKRKICGEKICFRKGDILYSKLRPYLLKILIADEDGICTPELIPFSMIGQINPRYILWVLRSPHIDYTINAVTYGVKMPRVGTDTMLNLLIPLPPIEEQQRIVERLEDLLPLCENVMGEKVCV